MQFQEQEISAVISETENYDSIQPYASDDELATYLRFRAPAAAIEESSLTSVAEIVEGRPTPVETHETQQDLSSIFEIRDDDPLNTEPLEESIPVEDDKLEEDQAATEDGNDDDAVEYNLFEEVDVSNSRSRHE